MAFAEARAAWQRTANRCLVQEDAKRVPKLACCSSSVASSVKQTETGTTDAAGGQDNIPTSASLPFDRNASHSNFYPNSKWWLKNYVYQKDLMDEQFTSPEGDIVRENSGDIAKNEYGSAIVDQTSQVESSFDDHCRNFITCEKKDVKVIEEKSSSVYFRNCQDPLKFELEEHVEVLREEGFVSCEVSKSSTDLYLDSESSWIRTEKNTPWWRTADAEELASLVAKRSLDVIENCDLPRPRNTRVKKNLSNNVRCLSRGEISNSLKVQKPGIEGHRRLSAHDSTPGSLNAAGSSCHKLSMVAQDQSLYSAKKPLRYNHERKPVMETLKDEAIKGQLLKALRHSQTRAREAEKVAKQAFAEKEHVVSLLFRQASQLFAYKQWLQILQLENMYFQLKNNKCESASTDFQLMLPWTTQKTRRMRKGWPSRKRAKRARTGFDVGRYAVVFALGLGIVGAGLLLGWTIGWMLPAW